MRQAVNCAWHKKKAWNNFFNLRDTSLKFHQQGLDMTRAALGGMTKTQGGVYSGNAIQNPYTQKIGNQQEDLRWLL